MRKRIGIENERLLRLIDALRKEKRPVWRRVAELLARPRRRRVVVNLRKIDKYAKNGDVVIIPGKVLGDGKLTKKIRVVAFSFSDNARKLIKESGSEYAFLDEYYPRNKDVKSPLILI